MSSVVSISPQLTTEFANNSKIKIRSPTLTFPTLTKGLANSLTVIAVQKCDESRETVIGNFESLLEQLIK